MTFTHTQISQNFYRVIIGKIWYWFSNDELLAAKFTDNSERLIYVVDNVSEEMQKHQQILLKLKTATKVAKSWLEEQIVVETTIQDKSQLVYMVQVLYHDGYSRGEYSIDCDTLEEARTTFADEELNKESYHAKDIYVLRGEYIKPSSF